MERLTESRAICGHYNLEAVGEKVCERICRDKGCLNCPIQNAFDRLAAYEDTGMMPEEIMVRDGKIKRFFREHIKEKEQLIAKSNDKEFNHQLAFAEREIIFLYSLIYNLSYEEGTKELCGRLHNENT